MFEFGGGMVAGGIFGGIFGWLLRWVGASFKENWRYYFDKWQTRRAFIRRSRDKVGVLFWRGYEKAEVRIACAQELGGGLGKPLKNPRWAARNRGVFRFTRSELTLPRRGDPPRFVRIEKVFNEEAVGAIETVLLPEEVGYFQSRRLGRQFWIEKKNLGLPKAVNRLSCRLEKANRRA